MLPGPIPNFRHTREQNLCTGTLPEVPNISPAKHNSRVSERIKALNTITSSSLQRVTKLIIKLGTNTTVPVLQHLVTETNIRPVVPANKRSAEEGTGRVLGVVAVVVVGEAEAVRPRAILVVDEQRAAAVYGELVAGAVVLAVARGSHADDVVALGEDDNVLPVVTVTTSKAAECGLVLFKVVLVPRNYGQPPKTRKGSFGGACMIAQKPLLQRLRE